MRFSAARLLSTEAVFAALFVLLLAPGEECDNLLPALLAALAVGGIVLIGRESDLGPALGVAAAFFVGMACGFFLAPWPMCVIGCWECAVFDVIVFNIIPVGAVFAFLFSLFLHRGD